MKSVVVILLQKTFKEGSVTFMIDNVPSVNTCNINHLKNFINGEIDLRQLKELLSRPCSLKHLCADTIIHKVGVKYMQNIEKLNLPSSVKKFILDE